MTDTVDFLAFIKYSYLSVVSNVVTQRHEAGLELLGLQAARPVLVEVEEGLPELVHLLVADALRVTRQDL